MSPDSRLDRIILVTLFRKATFRPLTNFFLVNVVKRSWISSLNMHLWVCGNKWRCAGIWKFLPSLLEKRVVLATMCNNSYVRHILFPHRMTVFQFHSDSGFCFCLSVILLLCFSFLVVTYQVLRPSCIFSHLTLHALLNCSILLANFWHCPGLISGPSPAPVSLCSPLSLLVILAIIQKSSFSVLHQLSTKVQQKFRKVQTL